MKAKKVVYLGYKISGKYIAKFADVLLWNLFILLKQLSEEFLDAKPERKISFHHTYDLVFTLFLLPRLKKEACGKTFVISSHTSCCKINIFLAASMIFNNISIRINLQIKLQFPPGSFSVTVMGSWQFLFALRTAAKRTITYDRQCFYSYHQEI